MMKPALALIALFFSVTVVANEYEPDMMPASDWNNETVEDGADNQFDPSRMYQFDDGAEEDRSTEFDSVISPYEYGDEIEDEYDYGSYEDMDMDEDEELPESELYEDE